jgi:DNA adenine methylase
MRIGVYANTRDRSLRTTQDRIKRFRGQWEPQKYQYRKPESRVEVESTGIILGNRGLEMAQKVRDGEVDAVMRMGVEVFGEGRVEIPEHPNRAEMPKAISIFRYPGGKSKLLKRIVTLIPLRDSPNHTYIEPFVGGGSVALAVAQKWPSVRLILNDRDENIYSFWQMVACGSDRNVEQLLALIRKRPTVKQFRRLRAMKPATSLDKAFHALFFNRTTFGGMAKSAPLGGYEQRGKGKIDSRWKPSKLTKDIETARRLLHGRTVVLNEDFEGVIARTDDRSFLYLDPPYYKAENELYTSCWKDDDHVRLKEALRGRANWLLSYDAHPRVQEIYRVPMFKVLATYSIAKNKCTELLVGQKFILPISEPGWYGIRDQLRIWVAPEQPPPK